MKYSPYIFLLFCMIFAFSFAPVSCAQEPEAPVAGTEDDAPDTPYAEDDGKWANLLYFTGIGCPHCANSDPVILNKRVRKGDVMIFEYEIYRDNVNAPLLMEYNKTYGAKLVVPQIVASSNKETGIISGDVPILRSLDALIKIHKGNGILLTNGEEKFEDLSFVKLPLKPKIWFKDRLAIREDSTSLQSERIKEFLINGGVPKECGPKGKASAPLSGGKIEFKNSCHFDGWVLMYD